MEIIVERRNPRDSTDLRNPGLEHISKITLKTVICSTNANTIIIRKQIELEKSGVNIFYNIKMLGLTLHSKQKIPAVKVITQSFQESSCSYRSTGKSTKQPNSFKNVLRGKLTWF